MTLQVSITFEDGKVARRAFATWLKNHAPTFKTKSMNKKSVTREEVGQVIHDALQQFCLNVTAFHEQAGLEKPEKKNGNAKLKEEG